MNVHRLTPARSITYTQFFIAVFFISIVVFATVARAEMTETQIAATIEARYGVSVLRVKKAPTLGEKTLAVTVMGPGGNTNAAYQVNTIAVDSTTGELVPVYGQTERGIRSAAPPVTTRTQPVTATD